MHVDSIDALWKLIQMNQLFMGGRGSHSQTQARCAAAHGDCCVSKYLWASCSGHVAMHKRANSWQPFRCLGIQVCRYSPNRVPKPQLRGFHLTYNRQQIPWKYPFHILQSLTAHFLFGWSLNAYDPVYTGQQACSYVPGYCNSTVVWAARTWTFLLYAIYMHQLFNWLHQVQYSHICWKYNSEQLWLDQTNKWRHQPHVVLGDEGRLVIVFVRVPWWVMSWIK